MKCLLSVISSYSSTLREPSTSFLAPYTQDSQASEPGYQGFYINHYIRSNGPSHGNSSLHSLTILESRANSANIVDQLKYKPLLYALLKIGSQDDRHPIIGENRLAMLERPAPRRLTCSRQLVLCIF